MGCLEKSKKCNKMLNLAIGLEQALGFERAGWEAISNESH
jgi:hypothetical protein